MKLPPLISLCYFVIVENSIKDAADRITSCIEPCLAQRQQRLLAFCVRISNECNIKYPAQISFTGSMQ